MKGNLVGVTAGGTHEGGTNQEYTVTSTTLTPITTRKDNDMIADNQPPKWEYKAVNIQSHRTPNEAELAQAAKVAEILNTDGQGYWELISTIHQTDNILPEGFVVLKRPFQAPKVAVAPKRSIFSPSPKVTAAAKTAATAGAVAVAPAAAKPLVAAALSPTAGKTDSKATA